MCRGGPSFFEPLEDALLNRRVVTKSREPSHVALATEPGQLAFGVPARSRLSFTDRILLAELSEEHSQSLAITEGPQGFAVAPVSRRGHPSERCARFLQQTRGEHALDTPIDAAVKLRPIGAQSDLEYLKPPQPSASATKDLRHRLAGHQADFNGADNLLRVVRVNSRCSLAIQTAKEAVKELPSPAPRQTT